MKRKFVVILFIMAVAASAMAQETQLKYDSAKKKNPFIPYVTGDGQLINVQEEDGDVRINLEGIIYDEGGQSMAIINGEILKKNDTIGNAKIVDIKREGIVYSKDGEIFTLSVKKEE